MTTPSSPSHEHKVLDRHFSAEAQRKLLEEDLEATKNTLTVVILIVTGGMLFGIFAVVMCVVLS